MMRDNTMYRQYHHEESPHKWLGMRGKGAGEVTPKGLYFRKGRVDEHSEIYPV